MSLLFYHAKYSCCRVELSGFLGKYFFVLYKLLILFFIHFSFQTGMIVVKNQIYVLDLSKEKILLKPDDKFKLHCFIFFL